MKVKVKICGIRSMEQAEEAITAGADFLGFNFVPTSKRIITPVKAQEITKKFKGKAILVGVFQDQSFDEVESIANTLSLDCVQLHGIEDKDFCRRLGLPIIKAFGHEEDFDLTKASRDMEHFNVSYYMVDRHKRGEGEMISLEKAAELATAFPLFFAGGLTPENVSHVVTNVRPFAVDVAGGIETDGMVDISKIKQFIKNAKEIVV